MGNLFLTFKLFGVPHIIYLLMAVVVTLSVVLVFKKFDGKFRRYTSIALLSVAGLFAILEFVGRLILKADLMSNLPLFSWDVFIGICIFVEITNKESWLKFAYFVIVPLSVLGLFIVPNFYTTVNAGSISVISYFMIESLLISYSILKLIWSGEYLSKKDIFNSFFNYIVIVAGVHIINVIFRFTTLAVYSNYWGTMGEDYNVTIGLIDKILLKMFDNEVGVPFVNLLPIFLVVFGLGFLMILPFDLLKTKRDRKQQMEEIVALGNLKAQQNYRKTGKSGSQILVRSETKASPKEKKKEFNREKDGFVSVNKQVQVNHDEEK